MASEASALEATAKAWRAEEPRVSKGLKDDRRVLLSGAIKAMIFEVWDIDVEAHGDTKPRRVPHSLTRDYPDPSLVGKFFGSRKACFFAFVGVLDGCSYTLYKSSV